LAITHLTGFLVYYDYNAWPKGGLSLFATFTTDAVGVVYAKLIDAWGLRERPPVAYLNFFNDLS
jgi:hypothetical protein